MATNKNPTRQPAGPATKGLSVVSRPASFMRCGRRFTADATVIPMSDLTADEVERLKDEPNLVVTEVDISAKAGDKAA